jgi:hypothetical protein
VGESTGGGAFLAEKEKKADMVGWHGTIKRNSKTPIGWEQILQGAARDPKGACNHHDVSVFALLAPADPFLRTSWDNTFFSQTYYIFFFLLFFSDSFCVGVGGIWRWGWGWGWGLILGE